MTSFTLLLHDAFAKYHLIWKTNTYAIQNIISLWFGPKHAECFQHLSKQSTSNYRNIHFKCCNCEAWSQWIKTPNTTLWNIFINAVTILITYKNVCRSKTMLINMMACLHRVVLTMVSSFIFLSGVGRFKNSSRPFCGIKRKMCWRNRMLVVSMNTDRHCKNRDSWSSLTIELKQDLKLKQLKTPASDMPII